jgi:hypothetical protein
LGPIEVAVNGRLSRCGSGSHAGHFRSVAAGHIQGISAGLAITIYGVYPAIGKGGTLFSLRCSAWLNGMAVNRS